MVEQIESDLASLFADNDLVQEIQENCAPRQRLLLSVLAICDKHELRSQKQELVSSFANDHPRTPLEARRRTRKFYWSRVEEFSNEYKTPVEDHAALKKHPRLLPQTVVLAMELENEAGTRDGFNEAWLNRSPDFIFDMSHRESFVATIIPLFLKAFVVLWVSVFILIKVIPEMKEMMEEFQVELPAIMTLTIQVADAIVKLWFLPALMILIAIPLAFPSLRRYLKRWNPFTWKQPARMSKVENRRALALRTLYGNSSAFDTIPGFKRLKRAISANESSNGKVEWKNFVAKSVITNKEASACETAESNSVRAWILRKNASKVRQRFEDNEKYLTRSILTVVNVLTGIMVVLFAVSIISILTTIITNLV